MKASTTDYLSITAALFAILLCGYGIGFLVGEKTTTQRFNTQSGDSQTHADWSAATIERLTRELQLSPEQQTAIRREIGITATSISHARQNAIQEYRTALIELHQRMAPHLDAKQRAIIEKSQGQLQLLLDNKVAPEN